MKIKNKQSPRVRENYYTVIEKFKRLGRNFYNVKQTFYSDSEQKIFSTSEILKLGDSAFDNINISGKNIYFVESKHNKKLEENKIKRNEKMQKLKMRELNKKAEHANKKRISLVNSPKNVDDKLQNYITNIENTYGYLNPKIDIKIFTKKDIENAFCDTSKNICYFNFEENWLKIYDEFLKDEKDEAYLLKDLEDFNTDAYLNAKSVKDNFSTYDDYIKFLCKEDVKVLSVEKGYYPYINSSKLDLLGYKEIVYLNLFNIISYLNDIELNFCNDITHISGKAFDFYPSKKESTLNEYKKVNLKVLKDSKLNIKDKKLLNELNKQYPILNIVFE